MTTAPGEATPDAEGPSPRLPAQGMMAAAGLVAVITLAGRAVGLARWIVFSHTVGTTCVGQVYGTTNTVPNVLYEIAAGGALAAVAVPLVAAPLQRGREDLADRAASALLTWAMLVLVPLSLLVAVLAGPLAGWLLGDVVESCDPAQTREAGRFMLLLFAPQVALYGVGVVLTGVLHAHRRFLEAALAPLLSSLVVIVVYLLFGLMIEADQPLSGLPTWALLLLAGGTTLGVVALSLPLLRPAGALGVRWRPTLRFPQGAGRAAGALAAAGLAAVAAQQLATVVVLRLTAGAGVAAINVWQYAQTAYLLPYAVLVVPLATVAFPRMAPGSPEAVPALRRALTGALLASVVGAAVLLAVREPVGGLFLLLDAGRGGAGRATLEALPTALGWLAPGLVGFSVVAVLSRALYAVGRPWAAALPTVLGWLTAALLPLVSTRGSDPGVEEVLRALAAGSTTGMTLAGLLLVAQVTSAWGPAPLRGLGRTVLAAVPGAAVGLLVASRWDPWGGDGWLALLGECVVDSLLVVVGAALMTLVLDQGALTRIRGRMDRQPATSKG